MAIEPELKETLGSFEKTLQKMGEVLERQKTEISEKGASTDATAKKVEALNATLEALGGDIKGMQERLNTAEAERNRIAQAQTQKAAELAPLGDLIVNSGEFKAALQAKSRNFEIPVPNGFGQYRQVKTLSGLAAATGADAIAPLRLAQIISNPMLPEMRIRSLIPAVSLVGTSQMQYVRKTAFYNLYALTTANITGGASTSVTVDNSYGFYPGQSITVDPGGANEETFVISTVTHSTKTLAFTATATKSSSSGEEIVSDTFVGTPETKLKPNAEPRIQLVTDNLVTMAHCMDASRQILDDALGLRAMINADGLDGLTLAEERQLLYGANVAGEQIRGLMTDADAQHYDWSAGYTGDTKLDAMRRAMTMSRRLHFPVDGVVVNPGDWEDIELTKGSDKHYIWVSVPEGGNYRVWRANVVETTSIDQGDFLVGAFRMGAMIRDGENATIRVSDQHENYFKRNMLAILFEQRILQAIFRPECFVVGEFDHAPVAAP